ncbi:hypothetical protein [Occallatibacter savannae]|uniref:hypothetical protein n=1 Tax=Occallatibacter savannae TaxID=1002691 RepID=UPI000D69B22D|nr:hypothetical protein [Occallatibacter savannae]
MRTALLARPLILHAHAEPPRDRTSLAARAVAKCQDEYHHAFALAKEKGLAQPKALRMASVAYKLAMPRMESLNAIRAAIACIAQGIALEVFDGRDGSQLLYAAQVAMSTLKAKGARKK